jgi:copper chaperone NosL
MALVAGALLIASLKLPLWHMRLEAPQYREEEALKIAVHPNAMKGDLRELKVLNQYIGVHVPPTLPQFKWLPWAITAGAALGIGAILTRRSFRPKALALAASGMIVALGFAAIQACLQMHDIGHKRDQKTVLVGLHDFTPPFLGTTKIAQFTVSSRFGSGAWLIGTALSLQIAAAWLSQRSGAPQAKPRTQPAHLKTIQQTPARVGSYKPITT